MIRHILRIIWNERRANGWLLIEFTFVFCVLWFCCDYLFYMGRIYVEPTGFDIENTYRLEMIRSTNYEGEEVNEYELAIQILERLERHPDIEKATLSQGSMPYGGRINHGTRTLYPDSVLVDMREKKVNAEYFDIFKIQPQSGRMPDPNATPQEVLISPDWRKAFGMHKDKPYPAEKVKTIGRPLDDDAKVVTGILPRLKDKFFEPYLPNYIEIRPRGDIKLSNSDELLVRIKPHAVKDFEKRFLEEMREQLSVGPYMLTSVSSIKEIRKNSIDGFGISDQLNSVYAITTFLIINIFLGIIGTFWYRIQSRQSEVGLRIALGASRKNVRNMFFTETLLLLLIASFIGINISIQLAQTDLLVSLGLPMADKVHTTSGAELYLIVYLITTFFLAMVSLLAVWYPARKASVIQPAEALRSE